MKSFRSVGKLDVLSNGRTILGVDE